jgi:hypothetical protein
VITQHIPATDLAIASSVQTFSTNDAGSDAPEVRVGASANIGTHTPALLDDELDDEAIIRKQVDSKHNHFR